jgi:hypothetical protein
MHEAGGRAGASLGIARRAPIRAPPGVTPGRVYTWKARIQDLSLKRRFGAVLLASHLINAEGARMSDQAWLTGQCVTYGLSQPV